MADIKLEQVRKDCEAKEKDLASKGYVRLCNDAVVEVLFEYVRKKIKKSTIFTKINIVTDLMVIIAVVVFLIFN